MATEKSTALATRTARVPLLVTPIRQIAQLRARMEEIKDCVIILCPFTSLDNIPYGYRVSERFFLPNLEIGKGDVYQDKKFCSSGEVALSKNGILGAWLAAGGSVVWSRRMDTRTIQHYVEWSVMLKLRQIDGNETTYPGEKTIDLRDGSSQAQGLTDGDLLNRRRHIVTTAETKAIERACRGILRLNQKYDIAELREKPFGTYALVEDDEQLDPETRRIVTLHRRGLVTQLYGPGTGVDDKPALPAGPIIEVRPDDNDTGPAPADQGEAERLREIHGTDNVDTALFGEPPPVVQTHVLQDIPEHLCGCGHGCEKEISEAVAKMTTERVGGKRCAECYPWGTGFSIPKHQGVRDMGFGINYRGLTGDQAIEAHRAYMEATSKKKGAGR